MKKNFKGECKLFLITFLLLISSLSFQSVSAENGENVIPNLESHPIENLTLTTPSIDNSEWELSVSVSENEENISKIKLETQICVYDPILCHAPQIIEMIESNNSWNGKIITLEKHSYVNWRIHLIYENGSETLIPERSDGYAKVWSNCWEIMEDQVIINNFEVCGKESSEDNNIPGFTTLFAIMSLILATSLTKKD
ncbi:MAG: hypothetical protein CMB64_01435 [Euryarchaeota archaeon]|nr:hypothetical protein [Euryarchaeota archaeon]